MATITAYINASNLRHNVGLIRQYCGSSRVCAVVKADAYGHDERLVTSVLADHVDAFAVVAPEAAESIYPYAKGKEIIILRGLYPGIDPEIIVMAQARGFNCTISSKNALNYVKTTINPQKKPLKLHLKIDSGMGRGGCWPQPADELLADIRRTPTVKITGVYTHFASADQVDLSFTRQQCQVFDKFISANKLKGYPNITCHACNSAAALRMPEAYFDMVRPGLAIYGYFSKDFHGKYDLRPVLRLEAPLIQIKRLSAGQSCGYGRSFIAARDMKVGLVPVGYADGMSRLMSNNSYVRIGENFAPVIGRVSMDQITIDLTDIPQLREGMTVVVIDDRVESLCNVQSIANYRNTICQEVFTGIGNRVKRVLVDDAAAKKPDIYTETD